MSLKQELEERVEGFLGGLPSDLRDELMQAFDVLVTSGIEKDALTVGSQSPMFSLLDLDEKEFSLAHVDPNYLRRAEPADILKALQKKAA